MRVLSIFLIVFFCMSAGYSQQVIRVGAKHFNEGYILSEIIALLLEDNGYTVERTFNLGGTAVSFQALKNNAIDVYPEYTGTIASEILHEPDLKDLSLIRESVKEKFDLGVSSMYGFNNTYALIMDHSLAQKLSIKKISDLIKHPELKFGLSYEFLKRQDGWDNLSQAYMLTQTPIGLEHGLAYQALLKEKINVTDAYSTDGEINNYNLLLLEDDRKFFPLYEAVSLYRNSLPVAARQVLAKLDGAISEPEMQYMNAQALFHNKSHRAIAKAFLSERKLIKDRSKNTDDNESIGGHILVHLWLTGMALLLAIIVALPLGVLIYRLPKVSRIVLYLTGILQTIPSIALLALMIPLFGIGTIPAIIALFLYALLPILRNTINGLTTIDPTLKKVAQAIGLNKWHSLKLIELPLAIPSILTGIRTAAVINVGTATLAAFIGAGGLGEYIVTGLALNNTSLILKGAVPAAIMAIMIELIFEIIEWRLVPKHLRQKIA